MGTEKYFFSVIIPTFERPEDLRKCLNSLDQTKEKGTTLRTDCN